MSQTVGGDIDSDWDEGCLWIVWWATYIQASCQRCNILSFSLSGHLTCPKCLKSSNPNNWNSEEQSSNNLPTFHSHFNNIRRGRVLTCTLTNVNYHHHCHNNWNSVDCGTKLKQLANALQCYNILSFSLSFSLKGVDISSPCRSNAPLGSDLCNVMWETRVHID